MSSARATRRQVVIFALDDDHFGADVFEVERVLSYVAPRPVPELPGWVAGLVEYSGRSIPIVDLRARFELPPAPDDVERRILVLGTAEARVGVVVDRVLEVASVPAESWDAPPPLFRGLASDYLHGVVRREGRLVMVLDAARLLSATERLVLERADD